MEGQNYFTIIYTNQGRNRRHLPYISFYWTWPIYCHHHRISHILHLFPESFLLYCLLFSITSSGFLSCCTYSLNLSSSIVSSSQSHLQDFSHAASILNTMISTSYSHLQDFIHAAHMLWIAHLLWSLLSHICGTSFILHIFCESLLLCCLLFSIKPQGFLSYCTNFLAHSTSVISSPQSHIQDFSIAAPIPWISLPLLSAVLVTSAEFNSCCSCCLDFSSSVISSHSYLQNFSHAALILWISLSIWCS